MQVAATLGFVLGRRNGQFLKGLRPKEVDAREPSESTRLSLPSSPIFRIEEAETTIRQYHDTVAYKLVDFLRYYVASKCRCVE